MARKIAGSVKDDKKWFYPDVSGFQFDTRPRDVANGRNNDGMNTDESLYGGRYVSIPWNKEGGTWQDAEEHSVAKYNGWMNWMHKFELDVRFGAVSDKNAYLYQFPEIQYPWKFTEYVFQGIDDDYIIIEPPLYDPATLTVWNGVKNPEGFVKDGPLEIYRREGKLKGEKYDDTEYELVYYYVCRYSKSSKPENIENGIWDTGPYRKQYEPDPELRKINGDLESGLVIAGKKYKPWTDPEASGCYKHTFVNTREACGVRKRFRYKVPNRGVYQQNNSDGTIEQKSTGIRIYRADIAAKCVDRGEHGNIPPYTINMAAPKEWLNPDGMYRNVVVPIVTATVGQAMYATDNGIIYYGSAMNPTIEIAVINQWSSTGRYINNIPDQRYFLNMFMPSKGDKKVQPKPMLGTKFQKMCVGSVADGISVGTYVHRGCAYFKGDETSGCYCEIKRKLLEDDGKNPVDNPDDFINIFGDIIKIGDTIIFDPKVGPQSASVCSSYSEKEGDNPAGSACRYYVEQGPKEIFTFTAEGMSSDDYAELSGYSQDVQNKKDTAMEMSGIGIGSVGAYAMSQYATLGQYDTVDSSGTLSGVTTRFKVEYEFKRVDAEGRQIKSDRAGSKSSANYDQVVLGTGKFAFDKYSSGYGGVDTEIFSGTNLMSRNRFCSSVMQCYNSEFCNKAYGPLKMGAGNADTIFAGVGDEEEYCRYYTGGCPTTEVHQRAREYDREYKKLITNVLKVFREYGIAGFDGFVEKSVGDGVYAAVSSTGFSAVETVRFSEGGSIVFMYDIGSNDQNHRKANVYGFVRQYGVSQKGGKIDRNNFLKMDVQTPAFISSTNGIPWLVKLHDDYVSPVKFESYATNMLPFIGGRMPEYKDFSKMGAEILCPVTTTELSYDGELTGGKGGDDSYNDTQSVTSYEGYRVDPTGEWIIEGEDENGDGISLGNLVPPEQNQSRASLPPGIVNGARPIKGSFSKTLMSSDGDIKARVTRAWVFSSDTRENIEASGPVMVETDDGEQKKVPIASVPEACLPTERGFYYCPKCSPHPYSWMSGEEPDYNDYGEKPIKQIFTDFEYQQYKYCPRCAAAGVETELVEGGDWRNFPKCRAYGTVNYFGLPGEIVRGTGYFWKNHTEVNRSLVSEFRSKLGEPNPGGGGPKLSKDRSANWQTESAVHKYGLVDGRFNPTNVKNEAKQRGSNIVVGYMTDEEYLDPDYKIPAKDSRYAMTDVKIGEETWKPKHMNDANQLDWYYDGGTQVYSEYRDRYINPYRINVGNSRNTDGLDFITANQLKYMRNMIEPVMGYPCFQETYEEVQVMKQAGYNNRKDLVRKSLHDELLGIDSFILASNDAHNDANYVQFWDGTLIPGKTVRAYYPTSPIWWFRRDYIGGIRRIGGKSAVHFNDSSNGITGGLYGYTGNLYTISFHSIQGWLPLDKEVVGAVMLCEGAMFPDEPPLGRTNAGGPMHDKHWHSRTPENWQPNQKAHDEEDMKALFAIIMYGDSVDEQGASPNNDYSEGNYWPVLYESEMFAGGDKVISQYNEQHFGWKTVQDFLEWKGFGEDLVQKYTEEEIWKKYTFQEFNDLVDGYTYDIGIEIGDPSEENSVQDTITVIPKDIADGLINNEGQAIPGMFDLTGLNTSLVYNKWGMPNAEKKYNSDWAEGGQVIIQSSVNAHADDGGSGGTSGMNSGADTLNGKYAGEGKTYSWDATKYVKGYYDDRVTRAFEAQGGIAYSEIWDYIKKNKVDLDKEGIIKGINNRYKDPNFDGYLLTNSFTYPKLDQNGDFPTIDEGGEYERSPMDIVDLDYCGKMYFDVTEKIGDTKPLDETNHLYYKYSPYNLVQTNDNNEPTGGTWDVDSSGNVVFVPGSTAAICRMASYRKNELYFTVNISGFPTETERRNYRFEAGSWNVSNAVCPNSNCFVHQDNATVSEAQAASLSGNRKYMRCSFVSTSTKCGACGTSLIDKDTGAMYVGGDGIKTVYYSHMPEKDSIINGVKIGIDTSVAYENNSFKVYARSSTSTYWTLLFSVKWLSRAKQWLWFEYDKDGNMVEKRGEELPNFKGKWVDGYDMSQPWILSGNHFLAYRGNKVKIVFEPETKDEYGQDLPNEGRKVSYTDAVVINQSDIISSFALKNKFSGVYGIEEGCMVEIFKGRDTSGEPDWQLEIQAYNEETGVITVKNALPALPGEPPEGEEQQYYYYRINMSKYMVTVREFKVFGFEVSDYLKMTEDADSLVIPVPSGAASVMFYDRATKILQARVMAGDASPYCLTDTGTTAPMTTNQLRYFVRKDNGATKYSIVGGEFFYDTFQNVIYLPVYCCMDGDAKREILDIDNVYNPDEVDQTTVPSAIEFRYINGAGKSIDLDITSIGEGPSYIVERDCIRCIYPDKKYDSEVNRIYSEYAGKSKWGTLPSMGQSVFLKRKMGRADLEWQVTNKDRTTYKFGGWSLNGLELAGGVSHAKLKGFMNGNDETFNGLDRKVNSDSSTDEVTRRLSGKSTGKITLTGLPNCIISGILCVYAPEKIVYSQNYNGNQITTYERTGGMKRTGFGFYVNKLAQRNESAKGGQLSCYAMSKPRLVVYLRERLLTEKIS